VFKLLVAGVAIAISTAPVAESAPPIVGAQGLTPNAWALVSYIQNTYPGVQSIGGVRADHLPDHPSGHALDLMIGTNTGLGDAIYADLSSHMAAHGIKYCLWRVPSHFNHVHVTVF
jgi:peptidoglycan DL-endopeptidase CwlO